MTLRRRLRPRGQSSAALLNDAFKACVGKSDLRDVSRRLQRALGFFQDQARLQFQRREPLAGALARGNLRQDIEKLRKDGRRPFGMMPYRIERRVQEFLIAQTGDQQSATAVRGSPPRWAAPGPRVRTAPLPDDQAQSSRCTDH